MSRLLRPSPPSDSINFEAIPAQNSKKMVHGHGTQVSYEVMDKSLKCGVCQRFLNVTPIVFSSAMKYGICGRCQSGTMTNISPQPLYEKLASQLTYPCSYHKDGCTQILEFAEVQTHEKICRFQTMSCPLSLLDLVHQPRCCWSGSAQMLHDHIQQHSDLFLDPPLFEWPKPGYNKMFFTNIGQKVVTVAVKYESEKKFLCLALLNDTDLKSQCYKYQLELVSEDKLSSILLRRDRLQCLLTGSHELETPQNALSVNLEKFSEMLQNSKTIFARIGIVKKNKKQIKQITGEVVSGPSSSAQPPEPDDLDEDLLSELECPVCNEFMIAPIFICPTGHSLCNVCKPKIKSCPTCKCPFTQGRNFTLEKLAAKITYPCTNRNVGCNFVNTANLIRGHENVCEFSKINCFFQCGWNGALPDLANHLNSKHRANQLINDKAFTFSIGDIASSPCYFLEVGNHLFVIELRGTLSSQRSSNLCSCQTCTWNQRLMLVKVHQMGQKSTDHVFQYNIQFSLDCGQSCPCLQLSYFCEVWTPKKGISEYGGENSLIIPETLLANYLNPSKNGYIKINIRQV